MRWLRGGPSEPPRFAGCQPGITCCSAAPEHAQLLLSLPLGLGLRLQLGLGLSGRMLSPP